ncbi:MAG TPA: hypothetical protein VLS48_05750 [Anaerolineales bacterium]|nr:hypothetical protein [Anaerolineales bacterium]
MTSMNVALTETADRQVKPVPPSPVRSLLAGFDAISNHIGLILLPVVVDLLLWIGPHVRLKALIEGFVDQVFAVTEPETAELVQTSRDIWLVVGERFNLVSVLRTYPVGVPSLMAGRLPVEMPGGMPVFWEAPSFWAAAGTWALVSLCGLVLGTLYFSGVSQAALYDSVHWQYTLRRLPWSALQILFLAFLWIGLLLVMSLPLSCMLSVLLAGGIPFSRFAVLLYGGVLIWALLPLVFSAHGVFVKDIPFVEAVRRSIKVTRMTFPATSLLVLGILLISEGLDILWNVPPETSWFMLVAVFGHAFVTTGLLAASFIFYRDADVWVERQYQQV